MIAFHFKMLLHRWIKKKHAYVALIKKLNKRLFFFLSSKILLEIKKIDV